MVVANTAHARVPKTYLEPRQPGYRKRPKPSRRPLVFRTLRRVLAGLFVLALALIVIYRYGQISKLNIDINRDTGVLNALTDEQRHLKIKIAELTGLERLEKVALDELGLRYPESDQFRYVGKKNPEGGDGDGE